MAPWSWNERNSWSVSLPLVATSRRSPPLPDSTQAKPESQRVHVIANGVTVPQIIAAVAEIAHCTLTYYFNRLANTDLDPFLERFRY